MVCLGVVMKSVRVVSWSPARFLLPVLFLLSCVCGLSAQSTPLLIWPQPAAIPFGTPLSQVQLDAQAYAGPAVQVPLADSYNVDGISTVGTPFAGGFDDSGLNYPGELIGSSITWKGIPFAIGPANQKNVVSGVNGPPTVPLPAGNYGSLLMLADMVNEIQPPYNTATFTITYTDGTTQPYVQKMSDWVFPRNYPGETVVSCYPYRYYINGSAEHDAACVYGYTIQLDPTKTVASITLPSGSAAPAGSAPDTPAVERDFVVLSFALVPSAVQGTFVYTPASGTVLPSGSQTLSTTFTPSTSGFGPANATMPLTVTPPVAPLATSVQWPTPAPVYARTPLSGTQLDAQGLFQPGPVLVPVQPSATVDATYTDGSLFFDIGGFDGKGNAFSASQLGSSLSYLGYTFPLSAPDVPSATSGTTIAIPQGTYTSLLLLGAAANGAQPGQLFTLGYSDGTSVPATLSLSSWDSSQSFPGETLVQSTKYANNYQGGETAGTYAVYGYQLPVDASKQLVSLTLPANPDVVLLALGALTPNPVEEAGTYTYTPPAGTVLPLGENPLSVLFTPTDTVDLASSTGSTMLLVDEPTLTVTADSYTRLYGAPNPVLSGTVTGQQYGDAFTAACSTTATQQSAPGAYPVVCTAQGSDIAAYQQVDVNGTLTITKAPVTAQVVASVASLVQGQPVILTATITSTTTGTPTGTVQFLADGIAVGTAPLSGGVATLSTTALPVGTDAVTIVYSGDTDFLGITVGAPNSIVITSADFTFTAPDGVTFSDSFGKSGSLPLQVAPLSSVYYASLTFSETPVLPGGGTCAVSPATVPVTAGPQLVTLTCSVPTLSRREDAPLTKPLSRSVPILCTLLFVPLFAFRRRLHGRAFSALFLLLAAAAMVPALSGCGSGYHSGSYPVVVTATDGLHTHTLTLTLDLSAPGH